MKNYSIISSVSWSLFGIQGLIGAFFAMIMRRALQNDNNGFIYNPETLGKNAVYQLVVDQVSVVATEAEILDIFSVFEICDKFIRFRLFCITL